MEPEALKCSLREWPVPDHVRRKLLETLWAASRNPDSNASNHDMAPYFDYYYERVQRLFIDSRRDFCIENHSRIVSIAGKILSGVSRGEIYQEISVWPDVESGAGDIDDAIDLCASLLLMAEVGESQTGLSGRTPILWKEGSLKAKLAEDFTPQMELRTDNPKLGRLFTARNLSRISGIRIEWTTNLVDHLRLIDDDQAVSVFHCASFLRFQDSLRDGPFPKSIIRETLNTLALLFPSTDRDTKCWLQSLAKSEKIDSQLGRCGSLRTSQRRLEKFSFWHDRLVILKQAFDESRPQSLSQWWLDRRNGVQWYTFWVAVLVFFVTILFGLIQSVTGVLQVYLSYKSLQQGR